VLGAAIETITTLGDVFLVVNPMTLLVSFLLGLFIVTIAGIYPAISATKISILETFRPRMKGLSKKHVNKSAVMAGIILLALGTAIPFIIGPNLVLTGLFIPTQLGITALITAGLILLFGATLYYVAIGLVTLFSPVLSESKIVIQRNVARNRKRTTLMFTMITIGIVFVIFFSSLAGTFTATFSTVIRVFTGSDIKLSTNDPVPYNFTYTINSVSGIQTSVPAFEGLAVPQQEPSILVGLIFTNSQEFLEVFPPVQTVQGPQAKRSI
ncbi:MAG: hypothetical protein ACTSQY_11780, partial [Candidatus Odinarchaeia archaeon]